MSEQKQPTGEYENLMRGKLTELEKAQANQPGVSSVAASCSHGGEEPACGPTRKRIEPMENVNEVSHVETPDSEQTRCSSHCSVVFPVSFNRESLLFDDYWLPPNPTPALTVLNYSCGRQSHRIAKGLLRGEIPMPPKLLVVSADPGNEHKDTIRIRDRTHAEFRERGIHAVIAPGPKMLDDLKERKRSGKTRIDNAALWTESGGQSPQKCTRYYKIAPMDRVVRAYLDYHMGIKSPKPNSVERWIGFAWDEQSRCKPIEQKYQQARWPLIEMGETKEDVEDWYTLTAKKCRHRQSATIAGRTVRLHSNESARQTRKGLRLPSSSMKNQGICHSSDFAKSATSAKHDCRW